MMNYPVRLAKDGECFLVTSPDFPELTTFGESRDEALLYAVSALEEAIAARIAHREDIPEPSAGRTLVALPTLTALKTLLYQAMRRAGVSKAALARRLNCHGPQVDRLLDLNHASRIDQVDAAFAALGQRIHVGVSPKPDKRVKRARQAAGKRNSRNAA